MDIFSDGDIYYVIEDREYADASAERLCRAARSARYAARQRAYAARAPFTPRHAYLSRRCPRERFHAVR